MTCSCGTGLALRAWAETLTTFERDVSYAEMEAREIASAVKEAESFFQTVWFSEIPKIESAVNSAAAQLTIETERILKEMAKATTTETLILAKQEDAVSQIEGISESIQSMKRQIDLKRSTASKQKEKQAELVNEIETIKKAASKLNSESDKIVKESRSLKLETTKLETTLTKIVKDLESLKLIEAEIPTTLADFESKQDEVEAELKALQTEDVGLSAEIADAEDVFETLIHSEDVENIMKREIVATELESRLEENRNDIESRVIELRPVPDRDPMVTQRMTDETLCRVLSLRAIREKQVVEIEELREVLLRHEERTIQAIKRLQPNSKK